MLSNANANTCICIHGIGLVRARTVSRYVVAKGKQWKMETKLNERHMARQKRIKKIRKQSPLNLLRCLHVVDVSPFLSPDNVEHAGGDSPGDYCSSRGHSTVRPTTIRGRSHRQARQNLPRSEILATQPVLSTRLEKRVHAYTLT